MYVYSYMEVNCDNMSRFCVAKIEMYFKGNSTFPRSYWCFGAKPDIRMYMYVEAFGYRHWKEISLKSSLSVGKILLMNWILKNV